MAFQLDIGFVSHKGRKEINEDFCAAMLPPPGQEDMGSIVAVADGVSTGGQGKEAAQTTVTSLVRGYFDTPETWDATVALDRLIAAQNAWLSGINQNRYPAMGLTTLTALVLRGQSYTLAHVGDTRCLLLREGKLQQLTHDHVMQHPDFKHQLLRCVGMENHVVVDYLQGEVLVGDVFLMLTDGVHVVLPERRLCEAVGAGDAQAASERMVAQAMDANSTDNLTVMVVKVLGLVERNLADANRVAQSLPIPSKLKVGESIDGLMVTAPVADNGVNVLYQVRDPKTQRLYALKTLHPSRARDEDERAMLAHEAWIAQRMRSSQVAEHLVRVHDDLPSGLDRSACYLLYDWHGGETLQQMLKKRCKLPPLQAVNLCSQVLRVLGRLHRQGVIHRDIKPANLHLGDDGVLRVLDLGVALSGREPESMRRLHAGTPSYVNPEQWGFRITPQGVEQGDGAADHALPVPQSDLFALGVTLYELLTGKLPYGEVLPYQVGRYHRDPAPLSRHQPDVPIWLNHVVLKAVARDQRLRFETAEEFLLALERGSSRPLTAPPVSPLLQRDPTMVWKLLLVFSGLFNLLLVYWLLFLPK